MYDNSINTEMISKYKRKPLVSIVVICDNEPSSLNKCINSLLKIKRQKRNFEFIIINNFKDNNSSLILKKELLKYNKDEFIYYQLSHRVYKSQLRNIGLYLSKGTWLFFMEDEDILTKKFTKFLSNFKFNIQIDFYRFPLLSSKWKVRRIGLFNNKYYSDNPSSLIINNEFIDKHNLRWDSNCGFSSTIIFLNKIYDIKNVNYIYMKKMYSVFHNFNNDIQEVLQKDFSDVEESYNILLNNKHRNYKQFIIILFNNYLSILSAKTKENEKIRKEVKERLKIAKINWFSYLLLPPRFFWKSIKLRWL